MTNSGFIEIITSGIMCRVINRCSRECVGSVWLSSRVGPICVDRNMCRE